MTHQPIHQPINTPDLPLDTGGSTLRSIVRTKVKQYIDELEGQPSTNLYSIFKKETEIAIIEVVLEHTQGNQSKASAILGMSRNTLRKKMDAYNIS